jgi:hypothetical protein
MSSEQRAEIERQYARIGVRPGDTLPLPRGLKGEADYLDFLRQVPDGSGIRGFTATMAKRAEHR